MSFLGYVRRDRRVGTRNYVLVLPQGIIAKSICDFVPGTKGIRTVDHGSGRTANDRETIARVLIGLGKNPNAASVIVHAATSGHSATTRATFPADGPSTSTPTCAMEPARPRATAIRNTTVEWPSEKKNPTRIGLCPAWGRFRVRLSTRAT